MSRFLKVGKYTKLLLNLIPNTHVNLGANLIELIKTRGYNFNKGGYCSSTIEDLSKHIILKKHVDISCRERALLFAVATKEILHKDIEIRRGFIPSKGYWSDHFVNKLGNKIVDLNFVIKNPKNSIIRKNSDFKYSWQVWNEVKNDYSYFKFNQKKPHYSNPHTERKEIPDIVAVVGNLLWDALASKNKIVPLDKNIKLGNLFGFDFRHFEKLSKHNEETAIKYFDKHKDKFERIAKHLKHEDTKIF